MSKLTQADIDGMSDEDFLNVDPSQLADLPVAEEVIPPVVNVDPDEEEVPAPEVVAPPVPPVAEDDDDEVDPPKEATQVPATPAVESKPATEAPATEVKTEIVEPAKADAVQDFYVKVTAPFKANGRDMQVANADEAIQLMQMGANYHKKMAALKPSLQLVKMLENAGLLDETKLSFLIDVASKKPEAISKLVQDSGIDPLDISPEKAGDYKPTDHSVSEQTLALDEVLGDLRLQGMDLYKKTLDVVSTQLDEASKQIVVGNPQVLRSLHQHIKDGVFDTVWAEVERQRTFNRLTGLSDLEAYRQVGDALAVEGKFKHLEGKATPQSQGTPPAQVIVAPAPKQADDDDRNKKRKAASPTQAATPSNGKATLTVHPYAMSDEDILKLDISKYR